MKKIVIICTFLLIFTSSIFAKETLVVVNRDAAAVQIIDPLEMRVLATIPVGEGPHEVIITSDGKTAIVTNYGAQKAGTSLSIIDLETQKETKRVDLLPMYRPHGIVEISGKVYFTAEVNNAVGRYDLASGKLDWMVGTGQQASHMLVVTPDQKRIYTANVAVDTVTALEFGGVPPAGSKVTHIPVGKQPEAIDISPDSKEVWVGLNAEGAIDVIDTATKKVVKKISLGERPYRVRFTPDGKQVVATMPNTKELIVIDAASREEIKRIKLESYPLGLIFSKDGKLAFISATQSDFVFKIDLEKGEVIGKVETGKASDGIALTGM
jgi:YVTN family beta-propeller protein